jgi:hypothetical protein
MTDPTPVPADLVELASAYLDGAASSDERARAEADPQVMAVVARLRRVRQSVGRPVPIDHHVREQALATALAAFPEPVSAVRSLDSARSRRRRHLAPLLGLAATVVLIAGVGIALVRRGGDGGAGTADAPVATDARTQPTDPFAKQAPALSTPADPTRVGSADPASSASPRPEAGAATQADTVIAADVLAPTGPLVANTPADLPPLVAALEAQRQSGVAPPTEDPCPAQDGDFAAPLDWQGTQAVLYLLPTLDAPNEAVVVEAATCASLASSPLPA